MRRTPFSAAVTSAMLSRSPTKTSAPASRSDCARSSSRRTNARAGWPCSSSMSTITLLTPPPTKVRRAGDGLRSQGFKIILWPLVGLPRRGDREDAAGHDLAVGQAHPGEGTVLVVDDLGDRGVDDADAAGGEAGAAVLVQVGAVGEVGQVLGQLPEQKRVADGGRAGGEDADGLIAHLPAVA